MNYKKLLYLFCSSLFLVSSGDAVASHPLEIHCESQEMPLEFWVHKPYGDVDTIITGKALKVVPTIRKQQDAACWAYFSISEALKGSTPKKMWVRVDAYPRHSLAEAYKNLEYCPFKQGTNYLIFGDHIQESTERKPSQWLGTSSSVGTNFHCAPNQEIDPCDDADSALLQKIRNIVKKGN